MKSCPSRSTGWPENNTCFLWLHPEDAAKPEEKAEEFMKALSESKGEEIIDDLQTKLKMWSPEKITATATTKTSDK
eukprot:7305659-Ditylum_brightwellii.AAC.1